MLELYKEYIKNNSVDAQPIIQWTHYGTICGRTRPENSGGTGGGSACSGDKKRGVGSLSIHSIYQLHITYREYRGV